MSHSSAWNELHAKFPQGAWPIDTPERLKAAWHSWCGNRLRFKLRHDEFIAVERRFHLRAAELGIVLLTNGSTANHEEFYGD
jgi:hypothetical protein